MAETTQTGGPAAADSTGTTAQAPAGTNNGSGSQTQTTSSGSDEDSFFDPKSIADKPELMSAYKQMQRDYTKGKQSIKAHQQKIEAYDRFTSSPVETMQQIASQYGYRMVQAAQEKQGEEDWNPQTWDDVMARAKKEVMKDLQPVYSELRELKKRNVETYLDTEHPDWRTYEDGMMDKLKNHPSLVNDPDSLYRLAVPDNILKARATKEAIEKLKTAGDGASVGGGSRTTRETSQTPSGPLTFDQAVEVARQKLARQGLKRPAD
jgi:RecG-like helicase